MTGNTREIWHLFQINHSPWPIKAAIIASLQPKPSSLSHAHLRWQMADRTGKYPCYRRYLLLLFTRIVQTITRITVNRHAMSAHGFHRVVSPSTTFVRHWAGGGPTQQTQNICIAFVQRRHNVFDVGPTLYKCYTNVCVYWEWLLSTGQPFHMTPGNRINQPNVGLMLDQRRRRWTDIGSALGRCLVLADTRHHYCHVFLGSLAHQSWLTANILTSRQSLQTCHHGNITTAIITHERGLLGISSKGQGP